MRTQNTNPDDDVLRLEDWVRQRLHGRVGGLRLHVRDEGLVLSGRTTTYYAKQLAQHTLLAATGLPLFANEIEVEGEAARLSWELSEDS